MLKKGDVYIGHWIDNLMDGKGVYLFASGDKYEGFWKSGL